MNLWLIQSLNSLALGGVLFLNPGAAGRPRFGGGLSVAILDIEAGQAEARIVPLV